MADATNPSLTPNNKAPIPDANLVNPLDQIKKTETQGSDLIKNIVATETGQSQQNILGDAPELDRSLLQDIEPPKSILLLILKIFFGLIFVASLALVLFFTSQLTDNFDYLTSKFKIPNVSEELSATNSQIIKLQNELNFHRYLKIKGYLDKFSYAGDAFLNNYEVANSQTSSSNEKNEASEDLIALHDNLQEALEGIKENFSKSFIAPLIDINFEDNNQLDSLYQEKLKAVLREKADVIGTGQDSQTKRDYRNYIQTINLVGKNDLKNLITQTDFVQLSDKEIYDFIKQVNSLVTNDLSVLQSIKAKRIKWSDIMNEIDLRTMAVDSHYSEDFYDDLGGIRYTNYEFESDSRKIVIVGETKKIFDTTNFTMIADLIDELNKSDLFENADMRSFSKSGSLDEGYIATLKLAFNLQDDLVAPQDESAPIDEVPEFLNK